MTMVQMVHIILIKGFNHEPLDGMQENIKHVGESL